MTPMTRKGPARRTPRLDDEELATLSVLRDDDELFAVSLRGDFTAAEFSDLEVRESRIDGAALTSSRLRRATFVDCVVVDSELSGAVLEDCHFERVEFRHCRVSGVQAAGCRFTDVALFDCKADGGNFRMTVWERGELRDSNLVDSDFYGTRMPGSHIHGCDLSNSDFSKCDLAGSHLQDSRLDGLRGGDSLRGVTIGTDQLIPVAVAIFAAIGISVDDD